MTIVTNHRERSTSHQMLKQIKSVTFDSVYFGFKRSYVEFDHTEFEPRLTRSPGRSRHAGGSVHQWPLLNNDLTVSTFRLSPAIRNFSLPPLYRYFIRHWYANKSRRKIYRTHSCPAAEFFFFLFFFFLKEHFSPFPRLYRSFGRWFVKVSTEVYIWDSFKSGTFIKFFFSFSIFSRWVFWEIHKWLTFEFETISSRGILYPWAPENLAFLFWSYYLLCHTRRNYCQLRWYHF